MKRRSKGFGFDALAMKKVCVLYRRRRFEDLAIIFEYILVRVGEGGKMGATAETAVFLAFNRRVAGKMPAMPVLTTGTNY
jgi:hypothetical protein